MGGEGRANGFVVVIEKLQFGNVAFYATKQDRVGPSLLSRSTVFTFCS